MSEVTIKYRKKNGLSWVVSIDIAGGTLELDLSESMILTGKLIEALNDIHKRENVDGTAGN